MAEVLFYHLERARLEHVLPDLLNKCQAKQWRSLVRTSSPERVEAIDGLLWTYDDASFLPHGTGGDAGDHPVWITSEHTAPDQRDVLFVVDGADLPIEHVANHVRTIVIFDGADSEAIQLSRNLWKALKETDHDITYWKQSQQGRWEKAG